MSLIENFKQLITHLPRRRRWQMAGLVVMMLTGTVAEMASLGAVVPFLAMLTDPGLITRYPVVQDLVARLGIGPSGIVYFAAGLFAVITLTAAFIRILLLRISSRFTYAIGADLGNRAYLRTLYQPYILHVSRNSSQIISGINKANRIATAVFGPLLQGMTSGLMIVGILIILFHIDLVASLIAALGFLLLYTLASRLTRQRLRENSEIISRNDIKRVKCVQEGLGGIRDIIIDDTHSVYTKRFNDLNWQSRRAEALNHFLANAPQYFIQATGMILIVGLACLLTARPEGISGALPILGALALGAQKMLPQMHQVYNAWSSVNSHRSQLQDAVELLVQPLPEEYQERMGMEVPSMPPSTGPEPIIALEHVGFRYIAAGPDVLRDVSLEISRGSRVGLIGKTGSGKSTLIDLIMGLLEASTGRIIVEGLVLTSQNRRGWQRLIAHVPQSIYLTDASIAENIAFGVDANQIDQQRLRHAAEKAQILNFIGSLPQQFLTVVGERGMRLSGGQRQRLGLARALYKQAEVLILDEATSALDDGTEAEVMQAIAALGQEVTVIMIAHRLSTLRDCDLIIELNEGRVDVRRDIDAIVRAGQAQEFA